MNRNIRASYMKAQSSTKYHGLVVRDLDIVDNAFLLQVDAVGDSDLRAVDKYTDTHIKYRVRIEQLETTASMATVDTFLLPLTPSTVLDDTTTMATHIPVNAVAMPDGMSTITRLLGIIFAQCISAGRLDLAMTLLDTGWAKFDGHHTFDARVTDSHNTVRIQFEVKNNLVRYKRTTLLTQVSPTKRISEVVPFEHVWPTKGTLTRNDLMDEFVKCLVEYGNGEPRTFTTVARDDLSESDLLPNNLLNIWWKIRWQGNISELATTLNERLTEDNSPYAFDELYTGPYAALIYKNVLVAFPEIID